MKKIPSTGKCLAYLRVSSGAQADSGLGLTAQRRNCVGQASVLGLQFKICCYDEIENQSGFFVDPHVSAFKNTFRERPAGSLCIAELEPGDTLIVSRMDRAFRNCADFIKQSTEFEEKGIRLVLCTPRIDFGTAIGALLGRNLASVAEWESKRRSERIIDGLRQKKLRESGDVKPAAERLTSLPSAWRPESAEEIRLIPPEQFTEGRVHIYIRCSHRSSAESGLGMLHQLEVAKHWADDLMSRNPKLVMGGVFTDSTVSATKSQLAHRPAGKEMVHQLIRGDHVIFASLDRGFRDPKDLFTSMALWVDNGVEMHFVNEGITMSDPAGRMMAATVVMFARMEADSIADRCRETRREIVMQGKFAGGKVPTFWCITINKKTKTKQLILDRRKIATYIYIQNLRRLTDLSVEECCKRAEFFLAKHENRPPIMSLEGAWKFTKVGKAQPAFVTSNMKGFKMPVWNLSMLSNAAAFFEKARSDWDQQAAVVRKLNQQIEAVQIERVESSRATYDVADHVSQTTSS